MYNCTSVRCLKWKTPQKIFLGNRSKTLYFYVFGCGAYVFFCSTYAIFNEKLFFQCTDSCAKEYKLYNKLLDKISPETELTVPGPSRKDGPAPVPILSISIPLILHNPPHSPSLTLSYKSPFSSSPLISEISILKIEKQC